MGRLADTGRMKIRSQVAAAAIAVLLVVGLAWGWYADAHPGYNPATYCEDLANGHEQQLPEGMAIDCAGGSGV